MEVDDYDLDTEVDFEPMKIESDMYCENENVPEEIKEWIEHKPKPNMEHTIMINVGAKRNPRELQIARGPTLAQKEEMTEFLTMNQVFVWSYENMVELSSEIVTHKAPIKEGYPLVKKLSRLKSEYSLKVKVKIIKQFKAGTIVVSTYS